jgi:hypothetical protein
LYRRDEGGALVPVKVGALMPPVNTAPESIWW